MVATLKFHTPADSSSLQLHVLATYLNQNFSFPLGPTIVSDLYLPNGIKIDRMVMQEARM